MEAVATVTYLTVTFRKRAQYHDTQNRHPYETERQNENGTFP